LDEFFLKKEIIDDEATSSSEVPENGLKGYWKFKNTKSLDGLPGIQTAYQSTRRFEEYGAPIKPYSAYTESPMTKELTNALPTVLVAAFAFSAGILLSARVHRIAERFGELIVSK
jgi:hypothetical protein